MAGTTNADTGVKSGACGSMLPGIWRCAVTRLTFLPSLKH
jgi:hypothetical protein